MGTVIFYAVCILAIMVSRLIWPHWWKRGPMLPPAVARPALPEGLPPGTQGARFTRLEDAQAGEYVAVIARVVGPAEAVGPVSRRACVASDLVVTDSRSGDRVARVLRAGTFTIDGGHATASVDARGAFVRVEYDVRRSGMEAAAFEDGVIPPGPRALAYTADEGIIAPGQYVLVIGMCERAGVGGDADYRSSADARLHIGGGGVRPSVVSTVPADLHSFDR